MQTTVKGLVKEINSRTARYGDIVVDTERDIKPYVQIDTKVEFSDGLSIGDEVEVSCWVNGSDGWTNNKGEVKYFTSLSASEVKVLRKSGGGQVVQESEPQDAGEDIPF